MEHVGIFHLTCCSHFPLFIDHIPKTWSDWEFILFSMQLGCSLSGLPTFSRTCSYTAIGLLLKVMALQKLACLLTVLWDMSMTICEPLVLGWKSSGKGDKLLHGWMGRQRLGLWWHLWDVAGNGPFRESEEKDEWLLRSWLHVAKNRDISVHFEIATNKRKQSENFGQRGD